MAGRAIRRVWTVVYRDANDVVGLGVVHFEDAENAQAFARAYQGTVRREDVPARIADRWTFTRWMPA
jgi:hypothetical protein